MNVRILRFSTMAGALSFVCFSFPAALRAQAGPGPIHPAAPNSSDSADSAPREPVKLRPAPKKENLIGSWSINPDESDDAHEKIEEARAKLPGGGGNNNPNRGTNSPNPTNNPYPGNGPGGNGPYGRPGQPYPGGNGPNNGPNGPGSRNASSGRSSGPYSSSPTLQDRQQMQDLIEPALVLTVTQKENEVDVTDDQGRKRVYFTDGRKPQPSKVENYQEATARWEGARLITNETGEHGGRITRTFELAPSGKQIVESVTLDSVRMGLVTIRYVFDATTSAPLAPAAK